MQQNFNSLEMVTAIRDAIRREAFSLDVPKKAGFIKISFVPAVKEADDTLGGLSEFPDEKSPLVPSFDDVVNYEYTYPLNPVFGFSAVEDSGYAGINIKKRKLVSGDPEGAGCVYTFDEFMEIVVRVSGADGNNKALAGAARGVISSFFEKYEEFSVS